MPDAEDEVRRGHRAGPCADAALGVQRMCQPVWELLGSRGWAGLAVSRFHAGRLAGVLFASDDVSRQLEELQETLGEGPGATALKAQSPVLVADLRREDPRQHWGEFRRCALDLGVATIQALPVQGGAVGLGVVTVHAVQPVDPDEAVSRGLIGLSQALADAFLEESSEISPGRVTHGPIGAGYLITHQAVGMVSAQMECSLENAMVAIRARAYADAVSVEEVARDVVRRRTRFTAGLGNQTPPRQDGRGTKG